MQKIMIFNSGIDDFKVNSRKIDFQMHSINQRLHLLVLSDVHNTSHP